MLYKHICDISFNNILYNIIIIFSDTNEYIVAY